MKAHVSRPSYFRGLHGPTIQRGCNLSSSEREARTLCFCAIHLNGRFGGLYALFVGSTQSRLECKTKFEEAVGRRKIVRKANKVFNLETLRADTSFAPSHVVDVGLSCSDDEHFTGKVIALFLLVCGPGCLRTPRVLTFLRYRYPR